MNEDETIPIDEPKATVLVDDDGPVEIKADVWVDGLIELAVVAIEEMNAGALRCRELSLAATHLQEAQNWLNRRSYDRALRGVTGTLKP